MRIGFKNIARTAFLGFVALIAVFALSTKTADASGLFRPANNLGLVGYWSFEDNGGALATDFSGNGNTGVLQNFEFDAADGWVNGRRGKALLFNGDAGGNDYVSSTSSNTNFTSENFTLATWVKFNTLQAGGSQANPALFHRGSLGTNGYTLQVRGDNKNIYFYTSQAGFTFEQTVSDVPGELTTDVWYHIVASRNGTSTKLYLNGAETPYSQQDSHVNPDSAATSSLVLGWRTDNCCAYHLDGIMDEARIYNRALSATEVAALYNTGAVRANDSLVGKGPTSGLVGHWTFDGQEASGTTTIDRSGSGSNGTLVNGPVVAPGKAGQALSFDGSNDYINISPTVNLTTTYTLSGWFYFASPIAGPTWQTLILDSVDDSGLVFRNDGTGTLYVVNSGSGSNMGAVSLGVWHHIAFSSNAGVARVYVDGVDIGGATGSAFNLARIGGGMEGTLAGQIDEVRVYSRSLSVAEVQQLYRLGGTQVNMSQNAKLTTGLVGLWSFDGPDMTSTTSTDRSGQGNNGTLNGSGGGQNKPKPVAGRMGQALTFDGTDDHVGITHGGVLAPSNNLSVSAWINKAAHTGDIVALGSNDSYWALAAYYNQKIEGSVAGQRFYSDTAIPLNQWAHVVMTYSADGSGGKIYVNGVLDSTPFASTSTIPSQTYVNIGATNMEGYFQGSIDDVRIYDRVLSAAEALQLYNLGK